MGNVASLLGSAVAGAFRSLLGGSCDGVCTGTWDVECFVEHLCFSSVARMIMAIILAGIMLFFVYLICKIGIIQCVVKDACKMAASACSASCRVCCLLWRKIRHTKRVYRGRRRRRDVEEGGLSSSSGDSDGHSDSDYGERSSDDDGRGQDRGRGEWESSFRTSRAREGQSPRERRNDRLRQSLRPRVISMKERATAPRSHGSERHHRRAGEWGGRDKAQGSSSVPPLHFHGSERRSQGHAHDHRTHI